MHEYKNLEIGGYHHQQIGWTSTLTLNSFAKIVGVAEGTFIKAYSSKAMASHPLEAELQELNQGLIYYHDRGIHNPQIEGDCLILV